jgi:putative transposase
MQRAGLRGATGRPRWVRVRPDTLAMDLVNRSSARSGPNQLWVTDITEHPTREGKVYCAVVLDWGHLPLAGDCSRRVVGWSIDSSPTAALVTMRWGWRSTRVARSRERSFPPTRACSLASWAFTDRAKASGLVPSMGSIRDCYDNSMIEASWSRMQVELLGRQRWKTRLELANVIFQYLEIWHNRQCRHSRLGMLPPVEFEKQQQITVARLQPPASAEPGTHQSLRTRRGGSD